MTGRFYIIVNDIFLALGEGGLFLILLCALSVVFLIALILSIVVKGYSVKERAWFIFVAIGFYFLQSGLSAVCGKNQGYSTLILFFAAIYSGIICSIRTKSKSKQSEREFARLVDDCIKQDDKPLSEEIAPPIEAPHFNKPQVQPARENVKKQEIDFGHVKSVIERLELCSLSASDKKALSDLKTAVYSAETMGLDLAVKEKINDGLSALLKIMAKYGI